MTHLSQITRKSHFPILLALAVTFTANQASSQPQDDSSASSARPNVLIILADDLGWSDTGAFGSEISTPNIDSLAGNGKKFTQFYNTARCCPSRASLLTGLYPHQAGVGHMLWPTGYPGYATRLTSDSVTMAEVLHDAGYGTYMAGKWHLAERVADPADPTGWPLQRGFDKFYGTLAGYGSFYDPATLCRDNTYITPENDPQYKTDSYYYTDAISDNAVKYLADHEQANDDKPFFMYVAYTAAHWPIHAPDDAIEPYKGKYDAGYDAIRQQRIDRLKELGLMEGIPESAPTVGEWDSVEDKAWEARRMEAYAGMISRMDQGIGKIIENLRATGELDNTLVLYMQDNGGCDEEFFHNNTKQPENVHVMGPDELQTRTLPPMQTRDGKVVKPGKGAMAGPAESFLGYGPGWANVSNTPLRLHKKFAHEGGISTPLIVHWPKGMGDANGELVREPAHLIDIMPTVLEVSQAEYPAERGGHKIQPTEGKSLLPLLKDESESFDRGEPIFWEHEGQRAVRQDKWKLVAEENKPWELYDISADRGELNNLADQHPDRVKEMDAAWWAYAERANVQPFGAHRLRDRAPDPEGTPDNVVLVTGDVYPRPNAPALSNAGIAITAEVNRMAPNGVIVAQGAGQHGYSVYMKDGKAHFVARRAGQHCELISDPIKGEGSATIKARVDRQGHATLQVNDQPAKSGEFYGPFLETPQEALSTGFDQYEPVGDYAENFNFMGDLEKVTVELIRK